MKPDYRPIVTHYLVCFFATLHALGPIGLALFSGNTSQIKFAIIVALYWTWPFWIRPIWRNRDINFKLSMTCLLIALGALMWVTPAALIMTLMLLPGRFHI
ncbi:MAG: hypothetical protein ACKVQK_21770 [Burkholderiales bacterium]